MELVNGGELDIAVFGDFDIVFEEKTPDIDEFDLVDELVLKAVVKRHPFVVEQVAVCIEHVASFAANVCRRGAKVLWEALRNSYS